MCTALRTTILLLSLSTMPLASAAELSRDEASLGARPAAFVALSVADLERVLPFYRDALGFRVFSKGEVPDRNIRYALLQHDGALIELLELPDARPRATVAPMIDDAAQIHGFFKSGFVVADIDAVHARMTRSGIELAFELGKPTNGPYRVFGVRDPEGNLLQIFGR